MGSPPPHPGTLTGQPKGWFQILMKSKSGSLSRHRSTRRCIIINNDDVDFGNTHSTHITTYLRIEVMYVSLFIQLAHSAHLIVFLLMF